MEFVLSKVTATALMGSPEVIVVPRAALNTVILMVNAEKESASVIETLRGRLVRQDAVRMTAMVMEYAMLRR